MFSISGQRTETHERRRGLVAVWWRAAVAARGTAGMQQTHRGVFWYDVPDGGVIAHGPSQRESPPERDTWRKNPELLTPQNPSVV